MSDAALVRELRTQIEEAAAEIERLREEMTAAQKLANVAKALLDDANAEIARLRKALAAERERCAKIADGMEDQWNREAGAP